MEEKKSYPPKQQNKSHQTLLGTILNSLCMLMLLSVVSWVFLVLWFSLESTLYKESSAYYDLRILLQNQQSFVYHHNQTILKMVLEYFKNIQHTARSMLNYVFNDKVGKNILEIIFGVAEIIIIRISTFIMSFPFLMVTLFIFSVDGLVQRDINKFKGKRESTLVFHSLKPLAGMSFFSLFLFYMAAPTVVNPQIIFILMAVVSGMFTLLTIKNFKKYL
jgi:hypothetical protein